MLALTGVIAYLTDKDTAVNVFTIGKIDIVLEKGGWIEVNGQNILTVI